VKDWSWVREEEGDGRGEVGDGRDAFYCFGECGGSCDVGDLDDLELGGVRV
jgi:hypothetical protein